MASVAASYTPIGDRPIDRGPANFPATGQPTTPAYMDVAVLYDGPSAQVTHSSAMTPVTDPDRANSSVSLRSPAKINWGLYVRGRRDDGFHDLASIFWEISLADVITATASNSDNLECPGLACPRDANLAWRALQLWRQAGGVAPAVSLHIDKRIPSGGGLGGGSSNAATVLRLLQDGATTPLALGKLQQIAGELGSDVPFFLHGGCAHGSGRGDVLKPHHATPRTLSLILPPFGCSTPDVFRALEPAHFHPTAELFATNHPTVPPNDLAVAACRAVPQLAPYLAYAKAHGGGLSGSGSTCIVPGHDITLPDSLPGQILRVTTKEQH